MSPKHRITFSPRSLGEEDIAKMRERCVKVFSKHNPDQAVLEYNKAAFNEVYLKCLADERIDWISKRWVGDPILGKLHRSGEWSSKRNGKAFLPSANSLATAGFHESSLHDVLTNAFLDAAASDHPIENLNKPFSGLVVFTLCEHVRVQAITEHDSPNRKERQQAFQTRVEFLFGKGKPKNVLQECVTLALIDHGLTNSHTESFFHYLQRTSIRGITRT